MREAMAAKKTTDAFELLDRLIGDRADLRALIAEERVNARVAREIHDLRTSRGLSQKELADLVGTHQSVIARLEDADYEGHSLRMLRRIAEALHAQLSVHLVPDKVVHDPRAAHRPSLRPRSPALRRRHVAPRDGPLSQHWLFVELAAQCFPVYLESRHDRPEHLERRVGLAPFDARVMRSIDVALQRHSALAERLGVPRAQRAQCVAERAASPGIPVHAIRYELVVVLHTAYLHSMMGTTTMGVPRVFGVRAAMSSFLL
jgi:transcriptional regulator with XRE-family HTH domain